VVIHYEEALYQVYAPLPFYLYLRVNEQKVALVEVLYYYSLLCQKAAYNQ